MNKDRLLRLADALEANAANPQGMRFDLALWGYKYSPNSRPPNFGNIPQENQFEDENEISVSCGTVGCAIGFAAISGMFKDEGFGFGLSGRGIIMPFFNGDDGWEAVSEFFDIPGRLALQLFDPNWYDVTRGADAERDVANRIRDAVEGKPIP